MTPWKLKMKNKRERLTPSVIKVGDGRGFVVNLTARTIGAQRGIITAAHCLPYLRPCLAVDERFYANLLGPIDAEPTVWTECLFADPIADIAVLGAPGDQQLGNVAEEYEALVKSVKPFSIADAPEQGQAWLLSLERKWFTCQARYAPWDNGPIWLTTDPKNIQGGMSGSPIVSDTGAAVGVISISSNAKDSGPNPRLLRDLPGWLSHAQQKQAAKAASKYTEAITEEIKRKSKPSK
jgi:hypothetical protein